MIHMHVVESGQLSLVSYMGNYTVSDYLIVFLVTGFPNVRKYVAILAFWHKSNYLKGSIFVSEHLVIN